MPHKAIGDFEAEDECDLLLHFKYNLFAVKCLFSYCGDGVPWGRGRRGQQGRADRPVRRLMMGTGEMVRNGEL